jgi:hypothetical protein
MRWWVPVGVVSAFWVPIGLALTWLTDMGVRTGGGPSRPMTLTEKSIMTVALVLWLAVLLGFRAWHHRRMREVLGALTTDNEAQGRTRAGEIEPPSTTWP